MKLILEHVEQQKSILERHPFFAWVTSEEIPLERRLQFLPALASFSMGFRDINLWVLRYPAAANDLERGINIHTFEDQTHSRLFLEDWQRLGLDNKLQWHASDTLWWLFSAEANRVARAQAPYFLSLAVADADDPLLRFAHSEVIETCGAVFFERIAPLAAELSRRTGTEYRYLGPYHLALESGHLDCEDLFEAEVLDDEHRNRAIELVDKMFKIFDVAFHSFLQYGQTYVATDMRPARAVVTPPANSNGAVQPPATAAPVENTVHASQLPLEQLLAACKTRTERHPLYTWMKNPGNLSALEVLQRFVPMWGMSIMGYRDLNAYVMRYENPSNDDERAVNGWVCDLETHSDLFLNDWQQLGLDELLGWNAAQTLEFLYLDPQMDSSRRTFVSFTELAARNKDPLRRLWLIHALEASGDAFFAHTKPLADEVERTTPRRLDYLADRHELAHQGAPARAPLTFKNRHIDAETHQAITQMIETVFDAVDGELTVSLDVALANKFGV